MQSKPSLLLAMLLLGVSATASNADPILNGSFETPTVPVGGFTDFAVGSSALTSWSVVGPAGTNVAIVSGSFSQNGVSFPAQDGVQWLDLTGDGSNSTEGVQQAVATIVGDQYQLSYWIGNTTGGGIFGTTSTVNVSLNGAPTFSDTNATSRGDDHFHESCPGCLVQRGRTDMDQPDPSLPRLLPIPAPRARGVSPPSQQRLLPRNHFLLVD
jgi:Protein of unknown function (DUF642)